MSLLQSTLCIISLFLLHPFADHADRTDPATRGYYSKTDAVIFVYDITNPETLDDSATWLKDIRLYLNSQLDIPVLFVGNKSDLVTEVTDFGVSEDEDVPKPEYATLKQAKNILEKEGLPLKPIECSAFTGTHVDKVFRVIASNLVGERPTRIWPCTML